MTLEFLNVEITGHLDESGVSGMIVTKNIYIGVGNMRMGGEC